MWFRPWWGYEVESCQAWATRAMLGLGLKSEELLGPSTGRRSELGPREMGPRIWPVQCSSWDISSLSFFFFLT